MSPTRDDMALFKDWLKGKICPICRQLLDNGTPLIVTPNFLVKHQTCVRPPIEH